MGRVGAFLVGDAGHDRVEQRLVVGERGEHEHGHVGVLGADVAAGKDAGAVGQAHVHDHDFGLVGAGAQDGLVGGAGLGDDLQVVMGLQHGAQAGADDLVVIDEHHPDHVASSVPMGTSSRTVVPCPGVLMTLSSAPSASARSRMLSKPRPTRGVAASKPAPSSVIWIAMRCSSTCPVIVRVEALACLAALDSASRTTCSRSGTTAAGTWASVPVRSSRWGRTSALTSYSRASSASPRDRPMPAAWLGRSWKM